MLLWLTVFVWGLWGFKEWRDAQGRGPLVGRARKRTLAFSPLGLGVQVPAATLFLGSFGVRGLGFGVLDKLPVVAQDDGEPSQYQRNVSRCSHSSLLLY